jgi:hypothetical protein
VAGAATTACTPDIIMAPLLVKLRVREGPDVDKDQGCADAVMGFKKAPDTLASEGEEVVSPSYSISTSSPASVASAVIVTTRVWPGAR